MGSGAELDAMTWGTDSPETPRGGALIDALLAEQGDLTAVERFAQFHEHADAPLQSRFYRSLMPAGPPGPGQQLAFEVDLDRCTGCKACVAACHALNGLDDEESWRDVGLLVGGDRGLPILQHVTSSCHHCLDPACLNACPVDAYEKDPITGIVRHLDDQCFGCQYCTLACPYDAPKYHAGKGIVRKCDMCADRLHAGEAPACVQSCPHEAIRIRVVDRDDVMARGMEGEFLATAPDPSFTLPTTRYVTNQPLGIRARPADHHRNAPEHVHPPLVAMLVLTQLSVGAFLMDLAMRAIGLGNGVITNALLAVGLVAGHLGLAASLAHLGRPRYAYRALIGLRHSWLSREVAAFGVFAIVATLHAGFVLLAPDWYGSHPAFALALAAASVAAGIAGVACSVMVYHVTRRPFWSARLSTAKFAGTTLLLGLATLFLVASWGAVFGNGSAARLVGTAAVAAMIAVIAAKLRGEAALLSHLDDQEENPLQGSALLLKGTLADAWMVRRILGFVGGVILPLLWLGTGEPMTPPAGAVVATLAWLVAIAAELVERSLFFAAVVRPKMPGGVLA